MLQTGRLLPSRRPLLVDIDARFDRLESAGLGGVLALQAALSSAARLKRLAAQTGLPEDYLILMKR